MGLLDFLFFTTPKKSTASFAGDNKLNRQDIISLVWNINSLDQSQKKLIQAELESQLDDGGVSKFEYKEIIHQLSLKRVDLGLSEIDIKNLKKVLYG